MCGIVGMVGLENRPANAHAIFSMMEVQRHRGPDDEGAAGCRWGGVQPEIEELHRKRMLGSPYDVVLGFDRLSIRDVTLAGHQPMLDDAGQVALIFNGEIYNSAQLKAQYLADYPFKSTTDTEVILALYLRFGLQRTLDEINGMFAFCIADMRSGQAYLARDRYGIKPLYICKHDGVLYFASEYKSILAATDMQRSLNTKALAEYFDFRTALHKTLMEGIESLKPGCVLTVTRGSASVQKYFELDAFRRDTAAPPDAQQRIEQLLRDAVRSQLVSDVPIGCQLSGGIDSSLASFLAAGAHNGRLDSVSIIFDDPRFSEEPWIDHVGTVVGLRQHKYRFATEEFIALLERCVWHQEAVITHPNCLCLQWLTKRAKENVTVLLSGEGADELFAGYPRHLRGAFEHPTDLDIILATNTISRPLRERLFPESGGLDTLTERLELLAGFSGSLFDRQVKYEFATYLPELLLRQDKMSMSNSIENRVPFLDNDLVDAVFALPQELLCRHMQDGTGVTKWLLKEMARRIFGSEFTDRKKMGFSVPVQNFIQNDAFRTYFYEMILPGVKKRGVLSAAALQDLFENISEQSYDYHEVEAFWRSLTSEIWCQLYLDRRAYIRSSV